MMKKEFLLLTLITFILCVAPVCAQVTLNISPADRGPRIGDRHYGIFFEEINHGGDGGLYAELIRDRSFEDAFDNNDNTKRSRWTVSGNGSSFTRKVRGDGQAWIFNKGFQDLINSNQTTCAEVTLGANGGALKNEGFWGMNIVKGTSYKLSFWIKSTKAVNVSAELHAQDNSVIGSTAIDISAKNEWQKVSATITATASDNLATFALVNNGTSNTSSFYLDVVSLFPPTYKDRSNGCRIDLAERLAAMKPAFVRFPGGCFIEGDYKDGNQNRFEWKKTIGEIETRPGHMSVHWDYRVTNGFGFHEMLQFTEDLGAEPLYVVNVGLGHGWYAEMKNLQPFIDDALDAIEYCNGTDPNNEWVAKRIAAGHPEPFNLRLIEIGNENANYSFDNNNDQSYQYHERYKKFYDAIKAKYPDMICIGDVQAWSTDEPSWRSDYPVDAVDEHYYRTPQWFVDSYHKYDSYDRTGPKVYAGEYAVTSNFGKEGNLDAALGEAIYMLGMENNSDMCIMNSYAPIFFNLNEWERFTGGNEPVWTPDMIRFNAYTSFGTPSYHVQQLFPNYVGKQNVKFETINNVFASTQANNKVGVSTWVTSAEFSNFTVTTASGAKSYTFAATEGWTYDGGSWSASDGTLTQTDVKMEGKLYLSPVIELGDNYTIELNAVKTGGNEGFLIAFKYQDSDNFAWLNLGGWTNSKHAIEVCRNGSKSTIAETAGKLDNNHTYKIKIVVEGGKATCYLDSKELFTANLAEQIEMQKKIYVSANIDDTTGKLYVKVVNPNSVAQNTTVNLKDYVTTGGKLVQMKSDSKKDENNLENPRKVYPEESYADVEGSVFTVNIPAYSVNIYELDVEPAYDIPNMDCSSMIDNADFERELYGWTVNGMNTQDNTEPNACKSGTYYCENWIDPVQTSQLPDCSVSKVITGLGKGTYKLTAICHAYDYRGDVNNPKPSTGASLFANVLNSNGEETHAEAVTVSAPNDYSVYVVVEEGDLLEIGFKAENTTATWVTVDNFRLTRVGDESIATRDVTLTGGQYATFSSRVPLAIPSSDVKVYTAVYNKAVSRTDLTRLEGDVIPANTGLLLWGKGDLKFEVTNKEAAPVEENHLRPTTTSMTAQQLLAQGGKSFVMTTGNVYKIVNEQTKGTLAAGKSYLWVPNVQRVPAMMSVFGGDDTTGIKQNVVISNDNIPMYNINGTRYTGRGIAIRKDGKKLFKK